MTHRIFAGVFVASMLAVAGVAAGDALKSGLAVGEKLPGPFHPLNATGAKAGAKHCLV